MVEGHQFLRIKDKLKNRDVEMEVNWNDSDEVDGCKAIRFKVGEETFIITQADLLATMLTIGSQKSQKKLLPTQLHNVRKTERLLTFNWKASRNYREGEEITVQAPWIDTHDEVEAVYAGAVATKKAKTNESKFIINP